MDTNGKFWRKALSSRRQAVAESDTSSETEKENGVSAKGCSICPKFCCNCCSCHSELQDSGIQVLKRKSSINSNGLLSGSDSKVSTKSTPYKEQLEIKILNEEMNEQLSYDKHNNSKKQIQDLSTLIRSFSAYVHSLDVRFKAAERLEKLLGEIIPEKQVSQLSKESCLISLPKRIKDILQVCYKNIDLPSNYYERCNEYSEKYKEHSEATFNFYYLLQNNKMPNSEMRHLEMEYDKVRNEFNESKTSVTSQLSGIINQRSEVIETCVQGILPLLNEMMEQDKGIYNMLKSFSSQHFNVRPEKTPSSRSLQGTKPSKPLRRSSEVGFGCRNTRNRCCMEENGDGF